MRNLHVLSYKQNGKVFFDFEDTLAGISLKDVINYFEENNIAIKMNDYAYIEVNNGKLNIYNLTDTQKLLYMKIDIEENIEKTELFERDLNNLKNARNYNELEINNFVTVLYSEGVNASIYSYYILNKIEYPNIKKSKEIKILKCKNYIRITDKIMDIESRFYKESNENYTYELTNSNVKVIDNSLKKKEFMIPSKLYPLPNSGKISVFTSNNTEELNNEAINKALTGEIFKAGNCYSNADRIIELIKQHNVDCKAEFYSGWVARSGRLIHHGWVLVDDKYVLDTSMFKQEEEILKTSSKVEVGLIDDTTHEQLCDIFANIIKDNNVDFKDKYIFGKVSKRCIYIGVKSDSSRAVSSYIKLTEEIPNHPEFFTTGGIGANKTIASVLSKL